MFKVVAVVESVVVDAVGIDVVGVNGVVDDVKVDTIGVNAVVVADADVVNAVLALFVEMFSFSKIVC